MEFKSKAMATVARMAAFAASVSADNAAESARAASAHTLKPYVPGVRIVNIAEEEAARLALAAQDRLANKDPKYAAQLELIKAVRSLQVDVQAMRQALAHVAELPAQLSAMQEGWEGQARKIVEMQAGIKRLLDRWDGDGLPTVRSR